MNRLPFIAYLNERFPVVNMALFAILFLTVYSVARYPDAALPLFGWPDLLGVGAVISFFFRLRVFDELKDYDLDMQNHPHRVLQSGQITRGQLIGVSLAGTLLELGWSLSVGIPALLGWGLAVGYSLLMRYEFFVPTYLKKRLVLYAVSHMLVMPLVIGWLWLAYAPVTGPTAGRLGLLALLSLLGGFAFELARKLHVPDAERPLIDSYSKSMGYVAAIVTVLLVLLIGVGVQYYLLHTLQTSRLPLLLIGLLYGAIVSVYAFSLRKPREKTLKQAELLVSLSMLVSYVAIILVVNF